MITYNSIVLWGVGLEKERKKIKDRHMWWSYDCAGGDSQSPVDVGLTAT